MTGLLSKQQRSTTSENLNENCLRYRDTDKLGDPPSNDYDILAISVKMRFAVASSRSSFVRNVQHWSSSGEAQCCVSHEPYISCNS